MINDFQAVLRWTGRIDMSPTTGGRIYGRTACASCQKLESAGLVPLDAYVGVASSESIELANNAWQQARGSVVSTVNELCVACGSVQARATSDMKRSKI